MGDLVNLAHRRAARAATREPHARPHVRFHFDVASPWTYLAAERVERQFAGAEWRPVMAADAGSPLTEPERASVERRATELAMPLVWPEHAGGGRAALRIAALAADQGCAPAFALAAGRLAYCGGFDLDDPETLAEAAAAAGLDLDTALRAAGDLSGDVALRDARRWLVAAGADELPALTVAGRVFSGERRFTEAFAATGAARESALRSIERS